LLAPQFTHTDIGSTSSVGRDFGRDEDVEDFGVLIFAEGAFGVDRRPCEAVAFDDIAFVSGASVLVKFEPSRDRKGAKPWVSPEKDRFLTQVPGL
jgi:hypothetical protein